MEVRSSFGCGLGPGNGTTSIELTGNCLHHQDLHVPSANIFWHTLRSAVSSILIVSLPGMVGSVFRGTNEGRTGGYRDEM